MCVCVDKMTIKKVKKIPSILHFDYVMFYLNKQRLNYYIILFVKPKYFHLQICYEEFMYRINDFLHCVKDTH